MHACRHKPWCVSDEQYIGTLLSWKLGDQVRFGYTDDMALALLKGGAGIPPEDIDVEFILQARGATANISRLYGFQDHLGECHAVERWAPLLLWSYLIQAHLISAYLMALRLI